MSGKEEGLRRKRKVGEYGDSADVPFPIRADDHVLAGREYERKVDVTKNVTADAWAGTATQWSFPDLRDRRTTMG